MIPNWRTSILFSLLVLIALILVLPQVDLPDVTSGRASVGFVRAHAPHVSASPFGIDLPVARLHSHERCSPVSRHPASETRLSFSLATSQLRC